MNHSNKLVRNTIALSVKMVITCIVQLIGTRIALSALGTEGFGLYNLLAGIIVLFSFLTGSLLISTQRFLSYAIGEGNNEKLNTIFNVSFGIHLIFSLFILILFLLIKQILFQTILNISDDYLVTAKVMYNIIVISTSITILSIPYSALMNAHEDMVAFAFIEILSLVIKLLAAISLLYISGNLLIIYTIVMSFAIVLSAFLKYLWCIVKYKESKLSLHLIKNKSLFTEMIGFVGWNTFGSAAVVVRNQGIAVLLNVFFGTVINAAYGIANQINSLVLSFATTLTTVFTPTIVQSKGQGNNEKMLKVAILSSKLSFLISSLIAIPILIYLEEILILWLKEIPDYTERFVVWIVLAFLIQQTYPGINRAIYAVGEIKSYQKSVSLILISIIPIGFILLKMNIDVVWVMITMFILQIFTLLSTIYYASKYCNLNGLDFLIKSVIKR